MANKEQEYKKLRSILNRYIRGKNTDAILKSLATGSVHLINNVEAVNDSLYIISAKDKFLDQRLGGKGVVRPSGVGLSDDIFREIGIEITNRTQVRDLIHQLLRVIYGEIFTRSTSAALELGPYFLEHGDTLKISFDDSTPIEVVFNENQFFNINNATPQEVASIITKAISRAGKKGAAFVREEEEGTRLVLISSTDGPSSSVKVLGGKAQNVLKFDQIRPISADATTEWIIERAKGSGLRAIWVGGTNPYISKIKAGDYVNIYGNAFADEDENNIGSFFVTEVGSNYFEYDNPAGSPVLTPFNQGSDDAILFFNPVRKTVYSNSRYASAFQTSPGVVEIFIPATTRVVRRNRQGAAHIQDGNSLSIPGQQGPFIYNPLKNFTISEISSSIETDLNINGNTIISLSDATSFPDSPGFLVFGFGTSQEEGPVPYTSRPSSKTLAISPSYKFKTKHISGSDVCLIQKLSAPLPDLVGNDTPFYLTDSVIGRIYAQNLINEIIAAGISVVFYILYPDDIGLGKWGDEVNSDKYYVWGTEEDI